MCMLPSISAISHAFRETRYPKYSVKTFARYDPQRLSKKSFTYYAIGWGESIKKVQS